MIFEDIYKDKKVIVTGHTGFKGSWLSIWLHNLGAIVYGISLSEKSEGSNYDSSNLKEKIKDIRSDIANLDEIKKDILDIKPDFIFHLAAQALVGESYINPHTTFNTNVMGSINILESVKDLKKECVVIMITSDKVYQNKETFWGYKETDKIWGKDPYSASKSMVEIAIESYLSSFLGPGNNNIKIGITRAGNVIGGGDWSLNRLVPDCMKSWSKNNTVKIRNPDSTRPWQHVLEPLSGYLLLGFYLKHNKFNGEAYNFGPNDRNNYSVRDVINQMSNLWDQVTWEDISNEKANFHESNLLKLNCEKAWHDLEWFPVLSFPETISYTTKWYKHYYKHNSCMFEFSSNQINNYVKTAKRMKVPWAKK